MSPRVQLRAATAAAHEQVDTLFSSLDLADRQDYSRFLLAHAAAFLPIEKALDAGGAADILDDWPRRRRSDLLHADLTGLGLDPPVPIDPPPFLNEAALLGGIYVLEGSRLGGKLLKKMVGAALPRQFLDADQEHGSWRKILDKLDQKLYAAEKLDAAITAARAVFQRFEAGGLRYLETSRA